MATNNNIVTMVNSWCSKYVNGELNVTENECDDIEAWDTSQVNNMYNLFAHKNLRPVQFRAES